MIFGDIFAKLCLLADEAAAAVATEEIPPTFFQKYGNLIFIAVIFALIYFMMIRPQKKKQQEQQNMQNALKAGDKVMTVNGAIGRIDRVGDKTIWIDFGTVKIEYVRAAIAEVLKDQA